MRGKKHDDFWFWAALAAFILVLTLNISLPAAKNAVFFQGAGALSPAARFLRDNFYNFALACFIIYYFAAFFYNKKTKKAGKLQKIRYKARFTFALGITLAIWELLTVKSRVFPVPYCPGASEIFCVIYDDRIFLLRCALYSLRLFFAGFLSGVLLGAGSGVAIGWSREWDYWLSPVIKVSGIIPAAAWLPVALLILPNAFITGVFLIFVSSWFSVSSMTAAGIRSTQRSYFDIARTFGASRRFILFRIAIPNAMPSFFTGIMTAAALSFTTLIISEMVGARAGLGFYINWAKGWGNYTKVYAAIIIIALEFSLILKLINSVKDKVLRWQKGFVL